MRSAMVRWVALAAVASMATVTSGCVLELRTGTGGGNVGSYTPPPPVTARGAPRGVAVGAPQPQSPQVQPVLAGVSLPPARQDPHVVHWGGLGGYQTVKMLPPTGVFGGNEDGQGALRGVLYFVPEGSMKLPDFSTLQPQGVTYTDQLNVPLQNFNGGFPGNPNRYEWFGFRYDGKFRASKTGNYDFHIFSDDGSIVYIDGRKVIDNDGVHLGGNVGVHGQVALSEGDHAIRVDYYQAYRWTLQLQLLVTPPGGRERLWAPVI